MTASAFYQLNVGWLQLTASPAYATYPKHQATLLGSRVRMYTHML